MVEMASSPCGVACRYGRSATIRPAAMGPWRDWRTWAAVMPSRAAIAVAWLGVAKSRRGRSGAVSASAAPTLYRHWSRPGNGRGHRNPLVRRMRAPP